MSTRRAQLEEALIEGDTLDELRIFAEVGERDHGCGDESKPEFRWMTIGELPEIEFDAGYGGEDGPRIIAFSERAVYVMGSYDGAEWIGAVPRHPEYVNAANVESIGSG